jgi:glucose-1-phosphate thymidylyltransferase
MIEWVLDNLAPIPDIETIYVVTNDKFATDFQNWADGYTNQHPNLKFKIVNDGSRSDADKLGAIGDIRLVINREDLTRAPLIVVAGDNLFSESLKDFGRFCQEKRQPVLGVYDVGSTEEAKKYGVIAVDETGVITSFEEKPADPKTTLIGIALYYYPKEAVSEFATYIAEGNNPDQPGRYVQWLYKRMPVQTWEVPGTWFDEGSTETLEEANRIFTKFQS